MIYNIITIIHMFIIVIICTNHIIDYNIDYNL